MIRRPWTMADLRRLDAVMAQPQPDLRTLAFALGRTECAVRRQAELRRIQKLRARPVRGEPGIECRRCKTITLWSQMPSHDPLALVAAIARWKHDHRRCKEVR